jgi:hypothetical protein
MTRSGGITHEVEMPRSSFHITANRLRLIGDTLSGADQEVVRKYADELETLAKCEVLPPKPIPLRGIEDQVGLAVFADILKSAFPLDPTPGFDDLLTALAGAE